MKLHKVETVSNDRQSRDSLPALMMTGCTKRKVKVVNMENLQTSKENALKAYKAARKVYLESMTKENWIVFCDAQSVCMRLGVRI